MKENRKMTKFSALLKLNRSKSGFLLFLLLALTILFGSQLNKLKFNYSFDSFFPKGDDELAYYDQFNKNFGQLNDFLFVVVKNQNPLDSTFLEQVLGLQKTLESLDSTEKVTTAFDLKGVQINPFGVNTYSFLTAQNPPDLNEIKSLDFYGQYFGKDDESIMLLLRHHQFESKKAADAYYLQLTNLIASFNFKDFIVSGKIQMQYDFTQKLEQELAYLLLAAMVIVVILLILLFRSLKGLIYPLLVLFLTLNWTMGFMALTGKDIDVMVIMIPPILLIVALSDVVHFVHKYDSLISNGNDSISAISKTLKTIGKATFLTSATTAIGFLGLLFLPIQPIREFGIYTATGIAFAFIITFLLLPALLTFNTRPVERSFKTSFSWAKLLDKSYNLTHQYQLRILYLVLILSILSVLGISQLKTSTGIIVGLQKQEPELEKVGYFDDFYDGYRPFELGIELENPELFTSRILEKIVDVEYFLESEYGVSHIESPLSIIREINSGLHGGSRRYYKIPDPSDLNRVKRIYNSPRLNAQTNLVQSNEGDLIRMIGRSKDLGSDHYRKLNLKLNDFLNELNTEEFEARITGASYLIDKTDESVVNALLKGIALGLGSISIFILAFFRSFRLAIVTILPNLIPIGILAGLMGWMGIDLNISTAIIFTVAYGIAVDDSIHFIARFYLERQKNDINMSIKNAFTQTGKSILVTSVIIVSGFSVFLISGFSAAYYLGLFIILASVIALLFDLLVLPQLLRKISIQK